MNGGEAVVETLRLAGVTHVFGLLGSSMMEVYDALYDCKDIAYVGVRDERSGTHMADAFGRVSGRPGVVLAGQAGPGAANLLTGLIQAKLAYSPLLALTGLASNDHLGRDAFQEFDQQAVFSPVTKRTWTVTSAKRIPEFIQEALRLASVGRRGPVVLNIPRDLFAENIEVEQPGWDARSAISGTVPDARSIEAIKTLLLGAKRPVIVAGGGVKSGRGVGCRRRPRADARPSHRRLGQACRCRAQRLSSDRRPGGAARQPNGLAAYPGSGRDPSARHPPGLQHDFLHL